MIHTFLALGQRLALDVESGAFYRLDALAYDAMKQWETVPRPLLGARLALTYPPDEVEETLQELAELEAIGQLNAQADPVQAQPPAGIVKAMCLHVAHDCNLKCRYCFADEGTYHGRDRSLMPFEVGAKALNFLIAHSGKRHALEVDFFGGEPLMNLAVVEELVAYGHTLEAKFDKHIAFTLTTNCMQLDDHAVDFLCREMDNVVLSLDGRQENHDRMRPRVGGQGSFEKAFANAKRFTAKRGQGKHYVRGTFTRHNLDFDKDVLYLHDQGFSQLSIEPVIAAPTAEYALTEADLPQVFAAYDRLATAILERRATGATINFFHFMMDLSHGPCLKKRLIGCGAGTEYVAVTPTGDLYPCHQFVGREGYRMGNVADGLLNEKIPMRFHQNTVDQKEGCRDCFAKYFCSGGCAANAEAFSGRLDAPNPLECKMQRHRLELALALNAMIP